LRAAHCSFHSGQSYGLAFESNSKGVLKDCKIQNNAKTGLAIYKNTELLLEKCSITDNNQHAIQAALNSKLSLNEAEIKHEQHELSAIILDDCAATISNCIIEAQATDIELANHAKLTLHGSDIQSATHYALVLNQYSKAIIKHPCTLKAPSKEKPIDQKDFSQLAYQG
jgi:hypothetical protein